MGWKTMPQLVVNISGSSLTQNLGINGSTLMFVDHHYQRTTTTTGSSLQMDHHYQRTIITTGSSLSLEHHFKWIITITRPLLPLDHHCHWNIISNGSSTSPDHHYHWIINITGVPSADDCCQRSSISASSQSLEFKQRIITRQGRSLDFIGIPAPSVNNMSVLQTFIKRVIDASDASLFQFTELIITSVPREVELDLESST